jgi:soluble lytic murein transglycosylase
LTARANRRKRAARKTPGRKGKRTKNSVKKGPGKSKDRSASSSSRPKPALIAAAILTGVLALAMGIWFAEEYRAGPGSGPYLPIIVRWSTEHSVDPVLVAAVLECESSGRPRAVSRSGALGLMQLMPGTAKAMAEELGLPGPSGSDLFDPDLNIRLGTYYLSKLWRRYEGDRLLAIAAYHAGPTNIDEWRKQRRYASTEAFVSEVNAPVTRAHVRRVIERWEALAAEVPFDKLTPPPP